MIFFGKNEGGGEITYMQMFRLHGEESLEDSDLLGFNRFAVGSFTPIQPLALCFNGHLNFSGQKCILEMESKSYGQFAQ